MNVLLKILRGFPVGAGFWAGELIALETGAPALPLDLTGIALGTAVALLMVPTVREGVLRRMANRPRRTMTPEDYEHLRAMETELGWEPSETPASARKAERRSPSDSRVIIAALKATAHLKPSDMIQLPDGQTMSRLELAALAGNTVRPVYCACSHPRDAVEVRAYGYAEPVAAYCRECGHQRGRRRTGVITAATALSDRAALSGTGTLSAPAREADAAAEHFAQLARIGRDRCTGFCAYCAERDMQDLRDLMAAERARAEAAREAARQAKDAIASVQQWIDKERRDGQ